MAAGTELHVSYVLARSPPNRRHRELQTHYGFVCTCGRCRDAFDTDPPHWARALCCVPDCSLTYPVSIVAAGDRDDDDDDDDEEERRCALCGRVQQPYDEYDYDEDAAAVAATTN